ncbi:MAG: endo-1,4-beta-xylanase [Lentisphaeria bacterium]|nr:endo-1,4-beta-xylanase [Lentisphaeria bacterium]
MSYTQLDMSQYNGAMSERYWNLWNPAVQAKIDRDIEANRKADAIFAVNASPGTEVLVEQLSHDFIFGAHIFNFDQLGSDDANAKYKALYGSLFNSATISFYWRELELEEGHPRFRPEYRDSAEFWNNCPNPKEQPHWRRPATDPVVDFCLGKGIRLHGHTLVWGNNTWQWPEWLVRRIPLKFLRNADFEFTNQGLKTYALYKILGDMTPDEIADAYPKFADDLNVLMAKRIIEIANRYGDKVDSWDVVNESADDYNAGFILPEKRLCKSGYGPMPGDYTYRGFKLAETFFPKKVKFNINDYHLEKYYMEQVRELKGRGCKIDIMGAQMHLFNPQYLLDLANGVRDDIQTPEQMYRTFGTLAQAETPIHLSEITITSPNNDERGQAIQAVVARNLYRIWFSLKPMMGITWWNVVDDCGAPGEPSVSGLFSRKMDPKPSYFVLDDLINHQWKTRLETTVGKDGHLHFRGFRGNYRLTWKNADGSTQTSTTHLA